MINKSLFSSNYQLWTTPTNIYNYYKKMGYFDVCPSNPLFDGLVIDWKNKNFCNPPYKDLKLWVKKAIKELFLGKETVFLVPSRTDTQWFKWLFNTNKAKFIFIEGRLKFGDSNTSAPFPSMFVFLLPRLKNSEFGYLDNFNFIKMFSVQV